MLGVSFQAVHARLNDAIPSLVKQMRGETIEMSQTIRDRLETSGIPLYEWLDAVAQNRAGWYVVPEPVWDDLRRLFPPGTTAYQPPESRTVWKTEYQLFRRRREGREVPRSEIFPAAENRGKRDGKRLIKVE